MSAPYCSDCRHVKTHVTILWIVPMRSPHPYCLRVRTPVGDPTFASIERMSPLGECGPSGRLFEAAR